MPQVSFPEGLTNRDCEKQMSDRPPLPFVPLATSTSEDSVFKWTGEPRQLEIKLSKDLKMPKNIFDGGTPEQFLYHIHLEVGKQFSINLNDNIEAAAFLTTQNAILNDAKFEAGEFIEFDKERLVLFPAPVCGRDGP